MRAHSQNLARKRAQEFGQVEITDGKLDARLSRDDDVVVTTEATQAEAQHRSDSSIALSPSSITGSFFPDAFDRKPRGFFADQFENESNWQAHYNGTGPEILRQSGGRLDAFVSGAGTGGTITGVGRYLKDHLPEVTVVLSDPQGTAPACMRTNLSSPPGSGLFNKVRFNVMYDHQEKEGSKRRHQVDTVVEGIGINRITHNFATGLDIIDDAYRVSDAEAIGMSRYLVEHDGLFLGSSSACNLVACVRLAKRLGKGSRIATIL